MDYSAILEELYRQRDLLAGALVKLEAINRTGAAFGKSRAGRKSMGPEERKEVSARMKNYWASRRKAPSR